MAQSPSSSPCAQLDDTFGPHVGYECRGGFDFTLLFEETMLTILPVGLMFLVLQPRLSYLWVRAKKVAAANYLGVAKISSWLVLAALQVAALGLWAKSSSEPLRTRATLATAALAPLSSLGFCLLSYAEHTRSVRPSSLLNTFLFVTLLFDIAHTRTLWLRAADNTSHVISYLAVVAVIVKGFVLLFEAVEKRRLLRSESQAYAVEATSSIFSRSFFWWLNPLFRFGFKHVLVVDDLFILDKHLQAEYNFTRFSAAWASVTNRKSPFTLLKTAFKILWWPIAQTLPPRAAVTALVFCQPFLINRAILLSQEPINDATTNAGYGLIGAYLLVYVGIAVMMGQYQHRTYRTIAMVRAGLITLIYRKTGSLSLLDIDPANSMTLMSADIERIVTGWQTMHEIWSNAVEVGVAIYLLEEQLGVACVVPVGVSIFSLLGSMVAMNFIMSSQAQWLEAIERRISATSAMLNSMKGVKMTGLKETLLASMQKLRVDELNISKRFRRLLIWNMMFAYCTQIFAPVLAFAIFSVRARDSGDQTLDTARVFTSLSLFALLSEPLTSLVMALASFLGAAGSFKRMQEFLESKERDDKRGYVPENSGTREGLTYPKVEAAAADSDTAVSESESEGAIVVHEADFGWDPEKPPLLSGINLTVPWHKLTMIVGPVGCGKSTLLNALLGELPALAGHVCIGSTSVAYCAQNPWHMNGTVRQAIIGGAVAEGIEFDEKWYNRVVRACALSRDFKELPLGDASPIGSGGIALSGGQSQRIALARAVYARREILILDDALGGLDMTTENHVFHSLLGEHGLLREMKTTVLIVSSSAKRLPYADHIISFGPKGDITGHGSFSELNEVGGYVSSFSLPKANWNYVSDDVGDEKLRDPIAIASSGHAIGHDQEEDKEIRAGSSDVSLTSSDTAVAERDEAADMSRATGDVQIYLYYIKSVGIWSALLFAFAICGFVFSISFPTVWVQWWARDNERDPNGRLGYWLGIYGALGGIALLCLFVSCWQMIINMVPRSGEKFHFSLLKTVLSAPMSFFVSTDSGEIINRFSQDLQHIDMELPLAAINTFTTFVLCLAQMALIGYGSTWAAISFPFVLVSVYYIQKFYLRTSRQLRLLDLEAKAPLYSLFEESLSGLATIRAFGWQDPLRLKNFTLLDRSQRPWYLLFAAQRWLTLVLDLVVAAIAVMLMVLVVELRGTVAAGGVGVALLNVIQFSQNIKLLVTFWTTLETHIGSVARIKGFTEATAPEDQEGEDKTPPPDWPSTGAIEFENLSATYGGDELVLKGVSLSIKAGEKIAICGRTGSGKTSLIGTLFRIVATTGGSIRVDDVDISTLPRQEVRSRIVGVPQHPFLLKGSVRLNADPMGQATDEAITSALQSVQLLETVIKNGGLDADIDTLNLSGGQRQLFCLARAMLRPSKILILDEATSSIDSKTEEVMQKLIRRKFANHTILAVAHRLETIMDFDKVAVLDGGKLVEFDSPYALLEVPGSAFGRLYNSHLAEEEEEAMEIGGGKKVEP